MKHPKKHLLILFSLLLLSLGLICFHMTRPQNIFEEIYRDEEWGMNAVFSSGVALANVKGIQNWGRYDVVDPISKIYPIERYRMDSIPEKYEEVSLSFAFSEKNFTIFFNREIDNDSFLTFANTYEADKHQLIRKLRLLKNKQLIDDSQEVQSFLDQYGITSDDLESYYKTIMDDLILKDWVSVYDSRFSPDHYGQVEIVTEW